MFDGFRLREPSARAFDALAGRVGAVVAGRNTYEDSDHVGGAGPTCAATPGSHSLTPADNPFQPVFVRGRVVEWLEGDDAWEIVDQISTKYTGGPTRAASSGLSRSSNPTGKASEEVPRPLPVSFG